MKKLFRIFKVQSDKYKANLKNISHAKRTLLVNHHLREMPTQISSPALLSTMIPVWITSRDPEIRINDIFTSNTTVWQ